MQIKRTTQIKQQRTSLKKNALIGFTILIAAIAGDRFIAASMQAAPIQAKRPEKQTAPVTFQPDWMKTFKWRSIGPTSMGGRIVDLVVDEKQPSTFWIVTASGGLFKTTNNGTTFTPQFQQQSSISIGDACIAPSNSNILWVGTGEHNARNSVSWGDGVYKSIDGGKTWKNMGLKKTFQIGRIAIHPKNPNIVYVGALGRLWGENKERGLYKTTDGGTTWKKIFYVDDKTGVVEVTMHPTNPDELLIATYERKRDPFDGNDPVKRFGPGSGMHRTTDGGKTWTRITKGLPTVKLGRLGITYSRSNPKHVFALVETEKIGLLMSDKKEPAYMGLQGITLKNGDVQIARVTSDSPADKAKLQSGDLIRQYDGKKVKSYAEFVKQIAKRTVGEKATLIVERDKKMVTISIVFGKNPRRPFGGRLGGQKENIQSKQGKKDGFQTGGVFKSIDGGQSWARINSLNPRPFYYSQIHVDPTDEKYIYILGVMMYRSSNGGKTFRSDAGKRLHPDHHAMWIDPKNGKHILLGCDGGLNVTYDRTANWEFFNNLPIGQFYDVGVDTRLPYRVYGGMQDNGSWGGPSRTRGSVGPMANDWYAVSGGDGFVCRVDPENPDIIYSESQLGGMSRLNLKTGDRSSIRPRAPKGEKGYRFNWKTPFLLSHDNSRIFYCAGNYVFKSLNRGDKPQRISPELSRTKRGTATALAESSLDARVLYVGTDDGNLWGTRNGGHTWKKLAIQGVKGQGLKGFRRVNAIEASRFQAGRCYVTLDGHYYDSDAPEIWVTEDYGTTWKSLKANLPEQCSTRVLREDAKNPNILYLGTEFGIYVSINRGEQWSRFHGNLPHVAIHEIAVHPTAGEIVAGTHGRSLWVLDVLPFRQLAQQKAIQKTTLLAPATGVHWHTFTGKRYYGSKYFRGENPSQGMPFYYQLAEKAKKISLIISTLDGKKIATLRIKNSAGLHRVTWSMRQMIRSLAKPTTKLTAEEIAARKRYYSRYGKRAEPGQYWATLTVDGKEFKQKFKIIADPNYPTKSLTYEEHEAMRKLKKILDD